MNAETLAGLANGALYAAMALFTLAMLAFAWYLALLAQPVESSQRRPVREPALVGAADQSTPVDSVPETGPVLDTETPSQPSERARRVGGTALSFTWLATALLCSAVIVRGIAVMRPPWGNLFEFVCAGAAASALVYSVLAKRNSWHWLGVFVVTPILLALGLAVTAFYVDAAELQPVLKSVWLGIHVTVAVLATGLWTIGFSAGVVFLLKERRDRGESGARRRSFLDALPSASRLERMTYSLNMVGFILYTFTLVAGAIWAQKAWGTYWNWDPKEVATFVVWSIYAAYMHARATAGWDARRSTYIALAGFAALVLNSTVVNLFALGMHSYSGM